ncbi:hypothetical protein [Nocardioides mesophilus]|uniref:Uncharacterized protein n=1 Tax=Nocardioides mesophilus TaxID=433659 RepID=A0A7G9RC60_9ACTN|nr:hypothetical protein [Nocardioides mesophilus]QNN53185.1 hypothetical protein H9L09_01435 [Nocardioides mesophilus]
MNEDPNFNVLMGDYCLACGVKRFPPRDQPLQIARAQASCPWEATRDLGLCEHTVVSNGQPGLCDRPIVNPIIEVCDRPGDHEAD